MLEKGQSRLIITNCIALVTAAISPCGQWDEIWHSGIRSRYDLLQLYAYLALEIIGNRITHVVLVCGGSY